MVKILRFLIHGHAPLQMDVMPSEFPHAMAAHRVSDSPSAVKGHNQILPIGACRERPRGQREIIEETARVAPGVIFAIVLPMMSTSRRWVSQQAAC